MHSQLKTHNVGALTRSYDGAVRLLRTTFRPFRWSDIPLPNTVITFIDWIPVACSPDKRPSPTKKTAFVRQETL
jgi:hypothetical protein